VTLWANDTLGNSNTATATFSVVHHDDEDCNSDWECGAWSSCNGGRQTRDCSCDCSHDEDCGGDGKESRVCGCQLNKDCDDGDPCTEDRCEDAVCENAPSSGASCDDGDNCTEGDICARGACKPGRYVCPVPCDKAWDCTEWSACVDGVQTRSCSCACADGQCLGDGSETFNCEAGVKKLQITKSAEELKEGEVLEIIVTDELGNPITANLVISRPQGAAIMATSPYTLIVDVNGTWEIQASKVGYLGDEDSAYVTAEKRASTAERTLFDQIISFLTSTTSAALLLALFGLLLFLLMRRRRKKRKVKKL
jgi:MYXO-CTERM domain-containing protein